jgi:serine/threonine-protein kinase RsbW
MHQTTTTTLLVWSRAFPAVPAQVGEARQFLSAILDGRPATADAILCLSELATNATVHSRSREPGGHFSVRVQLHGSHLRVEVADQGGSWTQPVTTDERNGRGLLIVDQLTRAWGRSGNAQTGWTIWFEMECW